MIKKNLTCIHVCKYLIYCFILQVLTDEFRFDYSQFWLSIMHRDFNKMKIYAKKLGINEDLYFLFAAMVTGRPWDTIKKGIDRTKPGETEVSSRIRNP